MMKVHEAQELLAARGYDIYYMGAKIITDYEARIQAEHEKLWREKQEAFKRYAHDPHR